MKRIITNIDTCLITTTCKIEGEMDKKLVAMDLKSSANRSMLW